MAHTFDIADLTIKEGTCAWLQNPAGYGIMEDENNLYHINKFSQIGWPDPFNPQFCNFLVLEKGPKNYRSRMIDINT